MAVAQYVWPVLWDISVNQTNMKRSIQQNKAIHKYCDLVAKELNREGHTMQDVIKKITRVEIEPDMKNVKDILWREIQKVVVHKKSTTELETDEVDKVFNTMNNFLGREFGVHVPFPNHEEMSIL